MTAMVDTVQEAAYREGWGEWLDRRSGPIMVLPAVIVLLCFAIFPLIISAYLALSRFSLSQGGFTLKFIGLLNFKKLLTGSQQYHLLGTFGMAGFLQWLVLLCVAAGVVFLLIRYLRRAPTLLGLLGRLLTSAVALGLTIVAVLTFSSGGVPGTVVNTLLYVFVGVTMQFALGLGLALLCGQPIRARNFFRVLFFIPLMVTPVGIAYTFRMIADMQKGPFAPLLRAFGATEWSWATEAWSARLMVLVGDTWQWTPFMFIVLLAAVENQPREQVEAARLDGANGLQIFPRHHLAGNRAGCRDHRPDPADRSVQDHRPPECAHRRRSRAGNGIDDAPFLHLMANAGPRRLGGGGLYAPLHLDDYVRVVLQFCCQAGTAVRSMSHATAHPRTAAVRADIRRQPGAGRQGRHLPAPLRLDAGRAGAALLGANHLVQRPRRGRQRAVLYSVRRLHPLDAGMGLHAAAKQYARPLLELGRGGAW